jgi:hypothetical protein
MTGVIYELIDPRSGTCRYVGQTFAPEERRRSHLAKKPVYQNNTPLHRWKTDLCAEGLSPEFRVVEGSVPASEINGREKTWCRRRAREGCDLLNRPSGHITKEDLLSSQRRQAIVTHAREVREIVGALTQMVCDDLPKVSVGRLNAACRQLVHFINDLDD